MESLAADSIVRAARSCSEQNKAISTADRESLGDGGREEGGNIGLVDATLVGRRFLISAMFVRCFFSFWSQTPMLPRKKGSLLTASYRYQTSIMTGGFLFFIELLQSALG